LCFVAGMQSSFIQSSEWDRAAARTSPGYKLGAKWCETVRCSTQEDIAAMYRITGTQFYLEHGRIVGNGGEAAVAIAVSGAKKKKEKKNTGVGGRMVEIQDRRITNARRPSFVGVLTANSKLR